MLFRSDNAPLRGGKGMLYEGGIRVPLIARWPGRIKAGSECAAPVNSVDLYPTLLEATGAPTPAGTPLDGTSYLPILRGEKPGQRRPLYWHFPGYLGAGLNSWRTLPGGAVRAGDWKLHEYFEDGRVELYNLRDDLGERRNLAADQPAKAAELRRLLTDWRAGVKAPMPTKNPNIRPPSRPKAGGGGDE